MEQSIWAFMTEFPKASLGFWGEEIFFFIEPINNIRDGESAEMLLTDS